MPPPTASKYLLCPQKSTFRITILYANYLHGTRDALADELVRNQKGLVGVQRDPGRLETGRNDASK